MLDDHIAEWTATIKNARHELTAVDLARRQGRQGGEASAAEEEGAVELELAQTDLAALEEAERLLRGLAAQLDDAGRGTLALAAKLLYEIDPCRPDALAGETTRLRELRLRMPPSAN